MTSEHENYQKRRMALSCRIAGVPNDSALSVVIAALVAKKEFANATELLFGTDRSSEIAIISDDRISFAIFMSLWTGRVASFISQIAVNHHWSTKNERPGLAIEVYTSEWIVIQEPSATNLLTTLM